MNDSGPLVKIKQALTRMKNEIVHMDLRIGVVSVRGKRVSSAWFCAGILLQFQSDSLIKSPGCPEILESICCFYFF